MNARFAGLALGGTAPALRGGAWLLLVLVAGCASTPAAVPTRALTPERLYPLTAGSAWSYDVDAGDGRPVLAITRVTEAGADHAVVQGGEGVIRYELRPDGIFRSDRNGYLLKAPIEVGRQWESAAGISARIDSTTVAIETPAGRFSACVDVVERGAPSGAVVTTTYCPDVGPVQVISSLALELNPGQSVRVVARLRGYAVGPLSAAPPPVAPALPPAPEPPAP
jgi:hypothetical protein